MREINVRVCVFVDAYMDVVVELSILNFMCMYVLEYEYLMRLCDTVDM